MPATVAALNRYPVKGLKGIALEAAQVGERGLEHDRRWMVVDREGVFISQRTHPRMATVWTELDGAALRLSVPDGDELEVKVGDASASVPVSVQVWRSTCDALAVSPRADAWLSDYLGLDCRLVYMPDSTRRESNPEYAPPGSLVGFADGYACLAIGDASLTELNARLAAKGHLPLPMNRFRPNIVISGTEPYAEDTWREVAIGEAVFRAAKPCGRCQVTTTDQATGEVRGPEPLETLGSYRDDAQFGVIFGMNWAVAKPGFIRVGDVARVRG
jgi:hypothetical protein